MRSKGNKLKLKVRRTTAKWKPKAVHLREQLLLPTNELLKSMRSIRLIEFQAGSALESKQREERVKKMLRIG